MFGSLGKNFMSTDLSYWNLTVRRNLAAYGRLVVETAPDAHISQIPRYVPQDYR